MTLASGIDVGTGAVKAVIFRVEDGQEDWLARSTLRIRQRDPVSFHTGHFYSMTSHARGARFLDPKTVTILDCGALMGGR